MSIYLLSITTGIKLIFLLGGILGVLGFGMIFFMKSDEGKYSYESEDDFKAKLKGLKGLIKIAAVMAIIGCFIPERDALIKSYLMLEGKEIINAENADKFFDNIDGKIDKLLGIEDNE